MGSCQVVGPGITRWPELKCILGSGRSLRGHQWLLWFPLGLSLKGPRQLSIGPLISGYSLGRAAGERGSQKGTVNS